MRIFSLSSLIAYIFGIAFTYQPFADTYIKGAEKILSLLHLDTSVTMPIPHTFNLMHLVVIFILLVIGLRFYLHAERIGHINEFFKALAKKSKFLHHVECVLRGCWVLLALNLPGIIAIQRLFHATPEPTPMDLALLYIFFFLILTIMYLAMMIWCYMYLDTLIDTAPNKGITLKNKIFLIGPDLVVFFICVCALIVANIFYSIKNYDIFPAMTAFVFFVIFFMIILQLLFFFFSTFINWLGSLAQWIRAL